MANSFPDNFEDDQPRLHCPDVHPQFKRSAEPESVLRRRQLPAPRRGDAYRIDKLAHQLAEIDRGFGRSRRRARYVFVLLPVTQSCIPSHKHP